MRCGVSDHSTAKCEQSGAPICLPDGGQDAFPTCLWCGVRGHRYSDCLRRIPSEVQKLTTDHSKTSQQTESHKQDIAELRLEMTSLRKGLESVNELRSQMADLNRKVDTISSWKHAHIAEHANLKLSFEQHVAWYELHVKETSATTRKFEDFLDNTWPEHKKRFDDFLSHAPPVPVTAGPSNNGVEHVEISSQEEEGDTDMRRSSLAGKRSASDGPPTTPRKPKRSTSATDKWWLKLQPLSPSDAASAWHDEILEAVVTEWDSTKWDRLIAWTGEWCDPEMCATARTLRSSGTTNHTLKSGLTTVLRGAAMPPKVLGSHPPLLNA